MSVGPASQRPIQVGDTAQRSRASRHDIELWSFRAPVRPGDVITAEVEVLEVREDEPISMLRTTEP